MDSKSITPIQFLRMYQNNPKKETANERKATEIREKLGIYADAYYGALEMAEWKDEQHEQEKQQWIDKAWEFWMHKFPYIGIDTMKEFVDTMKGE